MVVGVNFAGAQVYEPLVQIPGLPPGAVNLSMYLVGLYDFLLSIVGIVAVMMLIIGGMRYITAAGNQAAVSDAKDIITSALAGLLLAILSWVIVAEINPDVLYIKKPGAGFTSADNVDWGACGQYDSATATCICKDTVDISVAAITSQELCDRECRLQDHCMLDGARCFIREDINGPHFHHPSDDGALGQDGECYCIDGEKVTPAGGADCQTTCLNPANYHCLVADAKIGPDPNINIAFIGDYNLERRYCKYSSPEENPITVNNNSVVLLCGRYNLISGNPILQWQWDIAPIDGTYDITITEAVFQMGFPPYDSLLSTYAVLSANPQCKPSANPQAVTCPIRFRIEDTAGNSYEDINYLRILAP